MANTDRALTLELLLNASADHSPKAVAAFLREIADDVENFPDTDELGDVRQGCSHFVFDTTREDPDYTDGTALAVGYWAVRQ